VLACREGEGGALVSREGEGERAWKRLGGEGEAKNGPPPGQNTAAAVLPGKISSTAF
jgi:hypothetical protein